MITLQEINNRIISKGNQMASDVKNAITGITLHGSFQSDVPISKDVPSRPWMLTGYTCLAAGVIGAISSDSKWPYLIGALGLVSLGVGCSKKNQQSLPANSNAHSDFNIEEEKAFIIEKCNKILDSKKSEWDSFMESTKIEIQNLIKTSNISEEKKEEYLSHTYYPETLSLSTLSLIDKFDTIRSGSNVEPKIMSKKCDYANEVALIMVQTANKQTEIYSKIIL